LQEKLMMMRIQARLSAPVHNPLGEKQGRPDYALIARLRAIREEGDEALAAVERYDSDFSLKLYACIEEAAAERLLDDWLGRRVDVLRRTQGHLREIWKAAYHADQRQKG
jgi:hypothetical protein